MSYLLTLDETYKQIDAKFRVLHEQTDLTGYCKALYCGPDDFILGANFYKLIQDLKNIVKDSGHIYEPDLNALAMLHWTAFQFQTFPVEVAEPRAEDKQDAFTIAKIIGQFPPIHISFRGIVRTKHGLFMSGYPSWDINTLRDAFRTGWTGTIIREPHPQDICHATLLRFTQKPSDEQIDAIDKFVNKWKGILLGELRPRHWYYGYGTWLQGAGQPRLIASWPACPHHWILHRGLSAGPDATLENSQERLIAAIRSGWGVELDLWVDAGKLYLGHDWSVAEAGGPIEPFFLPFRTAWVHCKNMAALQYMLETRAECHYFVHDSDEATLTNTGEAWCYPGNYAGRRSICVLPERLPVIDAAFTVYEKELAGVCSDYLPEYFITTDVIKFY